MAHISQIKKMFALEGLLQNQPKKRLARELGVSEGSVRVWSIFVENNDFDWVEQTHTYHRLHNRNLAADYWFNHYPISYTEVARMFNVRPSAVYSKIKLDMSKMARDKLPYKFRLWGVLEDYMVKKKQTIDDIIPSIDKMLDERFKNCKNMEEGMAAIREILIVYECLFLEHIKDCPDEAKKKELERYLSHLRSMLASLEPAKSST